MYRTKRALRLASFVAHLLMAVFIIFGLQSYVSGGLAQSDSDLGGRSPVVRGWNPTAPDTTRFSPTQAVLEDSIIAYFNGMRVNSGVKPLPLDPLLSAFARSEASSLGRLESHTFRSSDGSYLDDRLARWQVDRIGRVEGLRSEVKDLRRPMFETVFELLKGWSNTKNQRAIMLDPHFSRAGVGVGQSGNDLSVVVVVFEDVLGLYQGYELPLQTTRGDTVSISGEAMGRFDASQLVPTLVRQHRGFFSPTVFDSIPLAIQWQDKRFQLQLPVDERGLHILRFVAGGVWLDTHPIEVN